MWMQCRTLYLGFTKFPKYYIFEGETKSTLSNSVMQNPSTISVIIYLYIKPILRMRPFE